MHAKVYDGELGGFGHDYDVYVEQGELEHLVGHIDEHTHGWAGLDTDGKVFTVNHDFDDLLREFSWREFSITLAPAKL